MFKKIILLLLVTMLIFFWIGFYFGKSHMEVHTNPEGVDMSLFWEAWYFIQDNYINEKELNNEKLIHGAISGMLEILNDDYTVFFSPEETEEFLTSSKGIFEGVGMEIGMKDKQLQVIAPLSNTPADQAGLISGDKILEVDGKTTKNMKPEKAVNLIRGPKESIVVLTIMRNGWQEPKEIKIKRDSIKIPSLELEYIDNIAHIKIYHFHKGLASEFNQAVNKILKKNTKGIILDLRNNPGGYLHVAIEIAEWFLEEGDIITYEQKNIGKEKSYQNDENGILLDYKLVVLINKGSASASEILAAALRDNRNIKIVGETSFGKGSVQTLEILKDLSSIKITTSRWLTPKKELINKIGINPDYVIETTGKNKDPQLDKALELIKKID